MIHWTEQGQGLSTTIPNGKVVGVPTAPADAPFSSEDRGGCLTGIQEWIWQTVPGPPIEAPEARETGPRVQVGGGDWASVNRAPQGALFSFVNCRASEQEVDDN